MLDKSGTERHPGSSEPALKCRIWERKSLVLVVLAICNFSCNSSILEVLTLSSLGS